MMKSLTFVIAGCSAVVVTAAIPHGATLGANVTLDEPGGMLVLAMAFFGLASFVRRQGKGPRRP